MKKTGAWLTTYALEQIGIRHTFGIPGVHVTELYDELGKSEQITPHLVTHEAHGAFMADAISRTSDQVGCLVIVPAAGLTHAMSGIGEAFLDGIPLLVISGGTRGDTGKHYQLHQMDQIKLVKSITKFAKRIECHADIIPTIFHAYNQAISGEPGPVFVEIPVEIQLFKGDVDALPNYQAPPEAPQPEAEIIKKAATLLKEAKQVGIFVGWGARHATEVLIQIAEKLEAPVSTTLQGLSVFPAKHPLHTGMGFSQAAVPAAHEAFKNCDVMLAIGTRFGEIPTGSFGAKVPEKLIHIDINAQVFDKNYPTQVRIHADAKQALEALNIQLGPIKKEGLMRALIRTHKENYRQEWLAHHSGDRVNPLHFFDALHAVFPDDTHLVVDDGNHTFLAAELSQNQHSRHFISPTDFNCMGYAVPAAIGVKRANPQANVVCIAGDGAFQMTCMEISNATHNKNGVVFCVFNDGELSQISQGQNKPYNRKVCTVLSTTDFQGIAMATGAEYVQMNGQSDLKTELQRARQWSQEGKPVIVDVIIDYSKETRFTKGVVATNLSRFPLSEKLRFLGRALGRKITG